MLNAPPKHARLGMRVPHEAGVIVPVRGGLVNGSPSDRASKVTWRPPCPCASSASCSCASRPPARTVATARRVSAGGAMPSQWTRATGKRAKNAGCIHGDGGSNSFSWITSLTEIKCSRGSGR